MKRATIVVGGVGLVLFGFVACGINPQPLPPDDISGTPTGQEQDAGKAPGRDDGSTDPNSGAGDAGGPPTDQDASLSEPDAATDDAGDADAATGDAEVDGGSDAATDDAG